VQVTKGLIFLLVTKGQADPMAQLFGLVAHLEYLIKIIQENRTENKARESSGLEGLGLPLDEDQLAKVQSYLLTKKCQERKRG
jgi:hypothetical protein